MPRPLTAADRNPEPGDVLYSRNGHRFTVTAILNLSPVGVVRVRVNHLPMWRQVPVGWRYASRADGGPVETEESK